MNEPYKLAILWSMWTPKVATRILRDLLSYQRLAHQTRTTLIVASDEELKPKVIELGFHHVSDFLDCTEVRVYVAEGNVPNDALAARVPDCTNVSHLFLQPTAPTPSLVVEKDPYGGVEFYKDWESIPETMPLGRTPPTNTKNIEPRQSPFI